MRGTTAAVAEVPDVARARPSVSEPGRVRRVLLLNYESPPAAGGAGFATMSIARELVRMGVAVDVLTARIPGAEDPEIPGLRVFRVPSWRKGVHDCGLRGAYSYVAFAALRRWQLLHERAYDLEHYFFSLPTGSLSLLPVARPPPYVVSLRGSDVPSYDAFNTRLERLHRLLLPVTRHIWNHAAAVVALSASLRETASRTLPALPIQVIPNGVDGARFRPAEVSHDTRDLHLVSVARLLERKGLHYLLEAIIAQPAPLPVRLTIIGTGPYQDELRRLTAALGLSDRVTFKGFVPNDQLADLYRGADLFVLPSQTESFGLVFAEAMASGLPILATRVGGIPDLVRHGLDGLLVEPADPHALRAALARLIANPAERRAMGASARARVLERYSWHQVAAQYLKVYECCLAARVPRTAAGPA